MYGPMVFKNLLWEILGLTRHLCDNTLLDYCRIHIGVSFEVCANVWKRITLNGTMPPKAQPEHLLWALMKLNLYDTDKRQAVVIQHDKETVRLWVWKMLEAIVSLKDLVVS